MIQSSPRCRNACLIPATFSGRHGFSLAAVPRVRIPHSSLQWAAQAQSRGAARPASGSPGRARVEGLIAPLEHTAAACAFDHRGYVDRVRCGMDNSITLRGTGSSL
jgi:hypothetical protein